MKCRAVDLYLHKKDIILSVSHVCLGRKNTSPSVRAPQSLIVCASRQDGTQVSINPQFQTQKPENRKPLSLHKWLVFGGGSGCSFIQKLSLQPWQAFRASQISSRKGLNDMRVTSPMGPDDAQRLSAVGGCELPKTSDVGIVWLTVKKHSWPLLNLQLDSISCSSFPIASLLSLLINAAVGRFHHCAHLHFFNCPLLQQ